jgi:hypothetical protein
MPSPATLGPGKDNLHSNAPGFIKDAYLTFLRDFFTSMPRGQGLFHFSGNEDAASELHITDQAAVLKTILEKRPSLVIQRGALGWGNLGLDQRKDLNLRDSREVHSDMLTGTMTIHCISRVDLEAERLAWNVLFAIKSLKAELQKRGIFEVGREGQLGTVTPPGALVGGDVDTHTVDVPVYSPFYAQITWAVKPVKETKLGRVDMQFSPKGVVFGPRGKRVVDLTGVQAEAHVGAD